MLCSYKVDMKTRDETYKFIITGSSSGRIQTVNENFVYVGVLPMQVLMIIRKCEKDRMEDSGTYT